MNSPVPPAQHPSQNLASLLRTIIAQEGPLSVERVMALALHHPTLGYYMTRDPLGAAGDFTTAPEISQMFGELLGLWAAEVWHTMGRPDRVRLVELGPGRATLMADALRAARALPAFRAAIDLHLVETSPVLRRTQERTLGASEATATWHATIETLPDGPALILANEFFDALPIRQYVRTDRGWCERLVGLDADGALTFGLAPEPEAALAMLPMGRETDEGAVAHRGPLFRRCPPPSATRGEGGLAGAVFEVCPAGLSIMRALATRIRAQGGALLAIDYGHARSGFADTLQAVKAHRSVDVLAEPGEADLTAHVDFAALARTATATGAALHGPVTQGAFLRDLGIEQRAAMLRRKAGPDQSAAIDTALARLTEPHPGMGDLFKVLALTHPDMPAPPGFPADLSP